SSPPSATALSLSAKPRRHYLPWLCAAVARPRDAPRPRIHALLARRDRIRGERPAAPSCPAPTRRRLAEAGSARLVEAGSATAELPPGWIHPHRASSQPVAAAWPGHAAAGVARRRCSAAAQFRRVLLRGRAEDKVRRNKHHQRSSSCINAPDNIRIFSLLYDMLLEIENSRHDYFGS
ncbi:hypothetical protein U9M48_012968, partial [Paspalum notatum var. saurae]